MGGKTGPAVVEEVTTKEGAGPGVYVTETDSSGWLKKGAKRPSGFVVWAGSIVHDKKTILDGK